ncbi:hypothetical protein PV367_31845 [Streptomyces europaeiscabiei]|uniref:Uncharacterized protein n=1 Tax=Streptomyces europaeiscabiei TaxID=146819 RepID=A0AAJ2UP51_9ACTN|nr:MULTISPECIES: hypothetical protein [Streptomyces]MDX3134278.1 hypothetical protein [Streptomyces europaeiscabiei]
MIVVVAAVVHLLAHLLVQYRAGRRGVPAAARRPPGRGTGGQGADQR